MSTVRPNQETKSGDNPEVTEEDPADKLSQELMELLSSDGKDEKNFPTVSDMSDRFPDNTPVTRVELRRVHNPTTGEVEPSKRVVEDAYVIGFIPDGDLPENGEVFHLYYHNYDGTLKFGHLSSFQPIYNVERHGEYIYFSNTGANWRLAILNIGN